LKIGAIIGSMSTLSQWVKPLFYISFFTLLAQCLNKVVKSTYESKYIYIYAYINLMYIRTTNIGNIEPLRHWLDYKKIFFKH